MNEVPDNVKEAIRTLHDWCYKQSCDCCPFHKWSGHKWPCKLNEKPRLFKGKELWQ